MAHRSIHIFPGQRFTRWTVIRENGRTEAGRILWLCQCDCGEQRTVVSSSLNIKNSKSCGCLKRELSKQRRLTHGATQNGEETVEFQTWQRIKARTNNPNEPSYRYYGERGITVCERWRDSFENFLADMGPRPSNKHSIERKNNALGYMPENCIWATQITQANNKRNNHLLTWEGRTLTLAQWSRELSIKQHTLIQRLRRGWSIARTLSTLSISTKH